jgi:hypothetical protein
MTGKSLDSYRNTEGKLWLNVASSIYVLPHFVNLDNHPMLRIMNWPKILKRAIPAKYRLSLESYRRANAIAPLIQHDCRKRLNLPDGSVDHILCSHFLEHVYPDEAEMILTDFHRVLKPGATVHLIVPDIRAQAQDYIEAAAAGDVAAADNFVRATLLTTDDRGTLKYRILEAMGAFGLQHRWMYDLPSLSAKVKAAGFRLIDLNDTPSCSYRKGDGSVHVVGRKELV